MKKLIISFNQLRANGSIARCLIFMCLKIFESVKISSGRVTTAVHWTSIMTILMKAMIATNILEYFHNNFVGLCYNLFPFFPRHPAASF